MPERFLILGEVHGTAECPRLALGLARSLRILGREAVLAIEWPADLQDDIAGGKWEELKSHGLFKAGDGRTSQAMVEVIRQAQGEGIPVLCFDQLQTGVKEREDGCARALRQISKEHPQANVVVLTGNRHSRIQGPPEDVPSTAMLLRAQGAEVLSIRLTAQRGEAWVLSAKGRGPQPVGSPLADSSPPSYRRHSSAQGGDHQARVHLESFSASQPWADELSTIRQGTESQADNGELARLFSDDQAARSGDPSKIDWSKLKLEDEARRMRVQQLLAQGEVRTGKDYWHAAFIFQHGTKPEDFLLAHALACASMARGYPRAAWLAAATLDRYLGNIGQPQIYGTQYVKGAEGRWTQGSYNSALIPDELRKLSGVRTLSEQEAMLREMQAGER
jgi:hypothetical protein